MNHFELFEKVTGRVSLKTGTILEAALKEACRKTGAQYHKAADEVLISGTWEQVSETRRIIRNVIEEDSTRHRSTSSSSDYSEGISPRPGRATYDTAPPVAKYMKSFHDSDLKNFEQKYQVKISWSKDYTKVHIKTHSSANYNGDLFNDACDQFAAMYRHFDNTVTSFSFNVNQDGTGYNKELLKAALNVIPRHVSGLILEISADGSTYILWGTGQSLSQAKLWIREQIGVKRPRCISPKGPSKDALTHETANKLKVVVYQGDLTKENSDLIVNACNEHLDHAGGVSYAISKAGGHSVQRDSDDYVRKHGVLKTGDVAVTKAGFLHCKYIAHAVGPQWKRDGREGCLKLFRAVFMNVYKAAIKHGAKSMAMPAISSGIYGVPKEVCAQAAFSFVDEVDQKLASDPSARPFEIRLVNIDGEIVKTFTQEFNKWMLKGRKVQRRHSFSSIKKEVKETSVETKTVDDMHKTPRLKASLVAVHKPLQNSGKDGRSSAATSMPSRIKHGSSGTSVGTSSLTPTINHGSTPAFSTTSGSKVKIITTGASTSPNPSDPTSSTSFATNQSKFNSFGSTTHTSTTGNPSHYGVASTSDSSLSKHDKSGSTTTVLYNQNGIGSHSSHSGDDCTICYCPYRDPVSLPKCGHTFCKSCIERAFTYQKKCPICQEVYGACEGDQPDGTMNVQFSHKCVPGYEGYGCYVITYVIPNGRQGSRHPKPGHKYVGTKRQAFLPATEEGEVVLKMLQKAFDMKLIFTVGKSNTTGQEDCVTWNDIHHKTSLSGGPQNFGYPDPGYLRRVKDELKAKGIVPE